MININSTSLQIAQCNRSAEKQEEMLAKVRQEVALLQDKLQQSEYSRQDLQAETANYKDRYTSLVGQLQKVENSAAAAGQKMEQQLADLKYMVQRETFSTWSLLTSYSLYCFPLFPHYIDILLKRELEVSERDTVCVCL